MSIQSYASSLFSTQREQDKPGQVKNNAGGYSFGIDKWAQFKRFLILGSEGGSYYVTERALTRENAKAAQACIAENGQKAVELIREISHAGRAPKNTPAIFALAMAASDTNLQTRNAALGSLSAVCRTGTHLFEFVEAVNSMRGWGSGLRKAVANWYNDKPADKLAYQVLKYQQRNKWSHRDVLRLTHPVAASATHESIFRWIATEGKTIGTERVIQRKGQPEFRYPALTATMPELLEKYSELKSTTDPKVVCGFIRDFGFTREMVPTASLNSADVWEALLETMPITAMIRNLGKMTNVGLLKPLSKASKHVVSVLADKDRLRKARVHPVQIISAMRTYQQGHGDKGSLTWTPDQTVVSALDNAFYSSFDTIEPTGKNHLLALDISSSMGSPCGNTGMTCAEATGVMAMATVNSEPNTLVMGFADKLINLPISKNMRLPEVMKVISGRNFGRTDCSVPFAYARQLALDVDAFFVYTDSETYAGVSHPHVEHAAYDKKMGKQSKFACVGMVSNGFSIADPNNPRHLDVVGFDTNTPAALAEFVRL